MTGFVLSTGVLVDIRAHALKAFPEEACGVVVGDAYRPCTNVAADPKANFRIAGAELVQALAGGKLQAVVHSHPTANPAPSSNDMTAQIGAKVPFVIVPTNGETCGTPVVWGENVDIAPLVGRSFVHGITDCFSAIRDRYRIATADAAAQGFPDWGIEPFTLPDVARDDGWWGEPGKPGADLYSKGLEPNGFTPVAMSAVKPGDLFLCKIKSDQFNHAGVLISNDLIFHHLPGRLSRREPASPWGRSAGLWVRRTKPS